MSALPTLALLNNLRVLCEQRNGPVNLVEACEESQDVTWSFGLVNLYSRVDDGIDVVGEWLSGVQNLYRVKTTRDAQDRRRILVSILAGRVCVEKVAQLLCINRC
jgi:hypothetical protein